MASISFSFIPCNFAERGRVAVVEKNLYLFSFRGAFVASMWTLTTMVFDKYLYVLLGFL